MTILPFSTDARSEQIGELAQRRLRESPYFYLKNLSCRFADGVLTLRGRVPFEQLKVFAELIVLRVDGVKEVVNWVEVVDPMARPSGAPRVRSAG
jgi:osmotically-inducible protein OsmY